MERLSVCIAGLPLKNPVIPASGTFGFGYEFSDYYDLNILGAICTKSTTLHPRPGNPLPRIAETPGGMLNAVGLQNPGIDAVLQKELPCLRRSYNGIVIANISGFSQDEYIECCQRMCQSPLVDAIELNISCPNVHGGGLAFGADPQTAGVITRAVRRVCSKPLFVKLTPNTSDISAIARSCQDAGADAISLINTLLGLRLDLRQRKPVLANVTGGLSGPAIFPVALRMVWQVYEAVQIPIIGIGGVQTARDVVEMMLCGASAVQIGAANLIDPLACSRIITQLPIVMDELGIQNISQIIGGAHTCRQM